ncbi:gliding motility-associated C-terminal domain-containing protein [Daejeonella rubra]|uniref:Gliding motility-associated C-terminal domain-containing protein n=1 Tax=Daejeonella rubra TaxID=990371 RepID=A0A1G9XGD5_9SPHI|nr:gliding motility-associated C-terminal domain-containing protein [Daejeonella rubra]
MLCLFFLFPTVLHAQAVNQVYIYPSANLYAHPNSNLNIYSDISHSGTFVSYDAALINFYSSIWQNNAGSRLPDESARGIDGVGGVFRFSDLLQLPQRINSMSPQPFNGFPNVRLDNSLNVTADLGNLHINNNLDFVNGNLILNNVDVNVGRQGTGTITGFSHRNFIVTGSAMTGGGLVRNTAGVPMSLDFPIGTDLASYTPLTINYTGIPQSIKFRVADNLYNKLNFPEYVNKTWIMSTTVIDASAKADLTLQHNSSEEGIEYFRNRDQAYVTRYDSKLTGLWDILPPVPTITPGTITLRAAVFGAYMNTRLNVATFKQIEYFSKSVIKKDIDENTPVNIPDAISPNGDGFNDVYEVVKRLPTDKIRFEVYSRNQVLVFQDFDYQNTFNGTGNMGGFMGNNLPDGIYYYLISVNGAKGIPGYLIINR